MQPDSEAQQTRSNDEKQQLPQPAVADLTHNKAFIEPSLRYRSRPSSRRSTSSADTRRIPRPAEGRSGVRDDTGDTDNAFDEEEVAIFDFAKSLYDEDQPSEPWFMEMTRLRRIYFLHLNRELAKLRKKILEGRRAYKADMDALRDLLHDQATAIRDWQYVKSLDYLVGGDMVKRRNQSLDYCRTNGISADPKVEPFETETYRILGRVPQAALEPFSDEVREFIRLWLPSRFTWTDAERKEKLELYKEGLAPNTLSPNVDRLARFTIAMAGALFILVPMYVMAIDQSQTKNLVTTTVAVVLSALLCSVTLRTSNDQTLGATATYAAVLMVFVGLTSSPGE